ncbi:cation diffusion facilitator family transporter [Desulforegula conservatrix]|uniref:cation diffusion facilitator family transporter n=1 Tax=Desulforegula conservatrix TaxID=153026 RepID=UPI00040E61EF|nr:cation diffusion facilitator family transporter [Desulforegula conservatrix]
MSNEMQPDIAANEKHSAAFNSVIAALLLTGFKLIVGLKTGSLGILAETAHSLLDMVAAIITLMAVRVADQPADDYHHYGHGKVENLSALAETFLLLVTCGWIFYESIQHLFFEPKKVDASIWAFVVMLTSIIIDFSRSRMLMKAAKKYNSQALEADALHFRTDIWSSMVVLIGLIGVKAAEFFPNQQFLEKTDAVSAMIVAVIVVVISIKLGKRSIDALIDTAPQDLPMQIKETVEALPHIIDCHGIRIRPSGAHLFIDLHVLMDGDQTLNHAHALTEQIEETIKKIIPNADVIVHAEPHQYHN